MVIYAHLYLCFKGSWTLWALIGRLYVASSLGPPCPKGLFLIRALMGRDTFDASLLISINIVALVSFVRVGHRATEVVMLLLFTYKHCWVSTMYLGMLAIHTL